MAETSDNLGTLEVAENIFANIKFFVSGEIPEKVVDLLKSGGAERLNYFSDYVTHLICGENPEENDISDANDLYEIPAVTSSWVFMCIKLKKLVNTKPYIYNLDKLFSSLVFCLSKPGKDREALWAIITYHGGVVQLNFDNKCTHLVTIDTSSPKYEKASTLGPEKITIVTPDWIVESVKTKSHQPADLYHPKLIRWPKVIKHESTTAITGFEPEKVEPVEKTGDSQVTDSTQALLDKLKQRMPWIQPQTTSSADIVPPNVVAPSFLSKNPQNQSQIRTFAQSQVTQQQPPPSPASTTFVQPPQNVISNQQIPRSIVHHTPQSQQMMQQQQSPQPQQQPAFNLPNQLHLNRLIGQQQNRPTLQQLRSQLGPAQLHHHLLQQRIAQQNQQNAQRPLSLQQQQLLQQQLAQGQLGPARQLLQNQQQQQLGQLNQQILQNQQQPQLQQNQLQQQGQVQQGNQQMNQMQQPVSIQNQQFGNIIQQPQHILQQQQQSQVLQQQQNQVLQQQQQNQVLQQQQQSQALQQQQNQVLQQQQQSQVLQQQNQILQQQGQALQQQQQGQVLQQQQQNPVLQQQQSQVLQQQQNQVLQQQNKMFVSQQQQQTSQQIVQNQPNLAIQQQFVGQNQQQFPQQQSPQQQPNQHFVQNQQDLNQQQNLLSQQVVQNPQFQPNNIINQQLLLNQQQNQFNQQQPNQAQPRPQINQHLWQQQQQQQATQQPQQQQQQQMTIRHPINIVQQGPRIQWSPNQQPNQPQRQYIHLDAQTHNELQKMNPEQQALFVQRLKQKQLLMQKQLAQRAGGGGGHILIRGSVPPGLNPQQQMQWLQRQAKQQGVVLPPNIQQQTIAQPSIQTPTLQHTPGLSPIQQQPPQFPDQNQQQQLQLRQQYRIQQLQLQREQAQKSQLAAAQQQQPGSAQPGVVRPLAPVIPDSTTNPPEANASQQLVVNAKTKTALANMLSSRLQSGGANVGPVPEAIPEPSAAGTLRLMTAQHNAALNPNNRPQDLIALQQRRVINGPNGEIIRALVPQAVPVMPQNEPPKVPFSPRAAVPMQHRPGPYYGHNPNLKLPPDLFLLGCIFVVVEIERYLDESLPGWQQKIEKYGGEVEKQYCTRVTHVLCETQRHGVVMQALRDCKRCVTVYWLSDVIKRKQVLPPWTALHLPAIYFDSTPAAKHLITLSGFTGCDRNRVKHMITYTGAKFTSYFSKHNTILIAAKAEGAKFVHAKKWGIPVVNVQWLTDIMLGNFTALNQTEHIMYQQFPTPPNFSFDPKLIPTLMHGWKAPINISQDSYERVKRSPSPVLMPKKAKKMKTEHTDENDNVNDEGVEVNCNYRILFSMSSEVGALQKMVRQLGGILAKSHQDCTHLVMPSLARTNKLLFCLCREVHIMPEQWLRDSQSAQKFLDEANYSLDTKDFNSEYKCDFAQTLNTKNRNKLFEGKSFWITPSVFPSKSALVELVQSCGGAVERIRRTAAQIEATNVNAPYSYIIITHENDIHLVADLLRNKKDKVRIVCSAELIFSAILKQTFEVEPYAVKVL